MRIDQERLSIRHTDLIKHSGQTMSFGTISETQLIRDLNLRHKQLFQLSAHRVHGIQAGRSF